jgi:hypothetical protein
MGRTLKRLGVRGVEQDGENQTYDSAIHPEMVKRTLPHLRGG